MNQLFYQLQQFIDFLNDNAGVIAFLSFLVAIFVPWMIYLKQRNDTNKAARQDAQDQLDAMDEVSRFPINSAAHQHYAKKEYLRKKANR